MNQNNTLLSFVLGAAVGGVAAYYVFKHQDEIVDKIHELEENLNIDHHEWVDKAKAQLERLTQTFQSTVERYTHADTEDAAKESEVSHILEELNRLRKEVQALS
ncbi:MAG: YtxH domain-containing protein [Sulfuricurvum sp.]|jgi:exonuclease VII large subunit|uniref:YtxH domain-containing protein n=1 Tax=Sulfuricurvum sp. TaxID=2025608 RepID=UPI0025F8F24C|nr:YtxH domain-containing protein [Sulfuricurvum sp.]MCK9374360.1 YtxH domain-containing protein [Sulfuricurvum sp.]